MSAIFVCSMCVCISGGKLAITLGLSHLDGCIKESAELEPQEPSNSEAMLELEYGLKGGGCFIHPPPPATAPAPVAPVPVAPVGAIPVAPVCVGPAGPVGGLSSLLCVDAGECICCCC